MRKKARGFSLIEMCLCIAIILIITILGVLNYSRQKADDAVTVSVQMVASDLKLAKDIASQSSVGSEIDFGPAEANGTFPILIKQNGTTVHQDNLPSQTTIATSWGSNLIDFEQNGSTTTFTTTGTITIGNNNTKVTKTVQVVPFTGGILK